MAQQATPLYHRQNYHTHFPNPPLPLGMAKPNREWQHLTRHLPYPINPAATARLSATIPDPDDLHADDDTTKVNDYLTDLQQAFPHLPAAQNPPVNGVKILAREVAGTTPAAIQAAFPETFRGFYAATTVGPEVRKQAGTLILVATGPNLTWMNSHIALDLRNQIATAEAANNEELVTQLKATFEEQQDAHKNAQTDWHNAVLFIKGRKLWLYDPSALTCQFIEGTNSYAEQVFQQVQNDTLPARGIDCRAVANLNMAREIFVRNYRNDGTATLGRRDSVEGFYIGGGGNVSRAMPGEFLENIAAGGDCRPMCGNFLALLAMLLWAEADTAQLSNDEVYEQKVNIDWLLGGFYNGLAKDDVQAQASGIPQWWRYNVY